MPRWDKITPALYGITNKIAIPIIQQKWDHIIVPVLRNERIIYQGVFDAYAITQARFLNAACGIEIFLTFVKHNGFSFVQDPIEIPLEQAPFQIQFLKFIGNWLRIIHIGKLVIIQNLGDIFHTQMRFKNGI